MLSFYRSFRYLITKFKANKTTNCSCAGWREGAFVEGAIVLEPENTSLSVNTIKMFGCDYRVVAWQIY